MCDPQTIIGLQDSNDWALNPTQPPRDLESKAPALWARLHDESVLGPAQRYEAADTEAGKSQAKFKATTNKANLAVLLVVCLGAATMAVGVLDRYLAGFSAGIALALGVGSVVIGAVATMWLTFIKEGRLLDDWMGNRAKAESARIEYFDKLTRIRDGDDPDLALLQLAYFRRYQLDVQLAYYGGRGRQHKEAAERTLKLRAGALCIGGIATGLAGILSGKAIEFSAFGALGVAATAFGAFASNRSLTNQDARNAERYARTHETLSRLGDRLKEVREALAQRQFDVLSAFVKAVNDEISLEHRQWLEEKSRYGGAIQELERRLEDAQKRREEKR